ncbi:MAG: anthranilate phosphoribosyltransferase [Bacteroidetes bacterium]|nr:anthranilate phosphoribosyltransferase [Bacteroidota bacterium]
MKKILNKLFEHQKLTREEAYETLTEITQGAANEAQIAAFLTVYLMRSISVEELDGFRQALLDLCVRLDVSDFETIDLCGTGGDGKNTFNISTLTSFVVAGAGGRVVKHGNYGVSSVCGSSNVLEAMGYRFKNDGSALCQELDEAGICFLHAPMFHPALKNVGPVRKALGIKTFFNMLGPLVNPARPDCQLTGVFNLELQRLYGYLLHSPPLEGGKGGVRRFNIVHTLGGYDELSLTAAAKSVSNRGEATLMPDDFGGAVTEAELFGGDTVQQAAEIFIHVLENNGTAAQKRVVAANAALALQCISPEKSLPDCIAQANESLESGRALAALKKLISLQ